MRKRLIKNIDWVVTVDEDRRMIADGAIAINGDRIEAVEKSRTLENAFAADETINGRGLIAVPGLIDTNVATVQQLGRGAADLCDIPKFLLERTFPYEAVLSPDDARAATRACQLEMIRSGTTCFADSGSRFPDIVADGGGQTGLRAMVPRACYDAYDTFMGSFPTAFARESTEETCRHAVSAIAAVRDVCCDRIQPACCASMAGSRE